MRTIALGTLVALLLAATAVVCASRQTRTPAAPAPRTADTSELPEWVRPFPVGGFGFVSPFTPTRHPWDERTRESLAMSPADIERLAEAEVRPLADEDPATRERACDMLRLLGDYTSLPGTVAPLRRLAAADPATRPDPKPGPPGKGGDLTWYPVRSAARDALTVIESRIDFDQRVAALSPEEREKVLLEGLREGRVPEAELLRMGSDAIAAEAARMASEPVEPTESRAEPRYDARSPRCERLAYLAGLLGVLGDARAQEALLTMLTDGSCRLVEDQPVRRMQAMPARPTHTVAPSEYRLEFPVRTAAARALAGLGYTVRVEGHEFVATR